MWAGHAGGGGSGEVDEEKRVTALPWVHRRGGAGGVARQREGVCGEVHREKGLTVRATAMPHRGLGMSSKQSSRFHRPSVK
jgi:hypothetical protein